MATHAEGVVRTTGARAGTGKRVLVVLAGVAIVALLAHGIQAIVEAVQPTGLETATAAVDDRSAGWLADDGEAVVNMFTEDGVMKDPGIGTISGREAIARDVENRSSGISSGARTGELAEVGDGGYRFAMEYTWNGQTWAGEVEIEFDGDLIQRFERLRWELQSELRLNG